MYEGSSEQRSVWKHVVRRLRFLGCSGEPIEKQEQVAKLYARSLTFDWRALLAEAAGSGPMSSADYSSAKQNSKKPPLSQNTSSHGVHLSRLTVPQIRARKGKERIVGLTAHSAPIASILDPWVDLLLVGDSLGMVVHGLPTTVGVTLEMMIMHGRAVMRGSNRALVVVDLPFGSYERSPEQAHDSAVRVMQETGCQAIKVEAAEGVFDTVAFLVRRGIPVVGHVGLRPQAANLYGGFKAKGRTASEREAVLLEARAVDAAGAFAMVVEGVGVELADEITDLVSIPTIGIGASSNCDGQILVTDDIIGLFEWTPKFVRRYGSARDMISNAVQDYATDVRSGAFPDASEIYAFKSKTADVD